MNRYNFTEERIKALKSYVKKPEGRKPVVLNKHEATIQKGKLYLDGKQVIPKNKVEETLRRKILSGQIPLTRDAAFYWLSKKYVGLSRKAVDDFLKKQRIIRETDNAKAKTTATNRKVGEAGEHDSMETDMPSDADLEADIEALTKAAMDAIPHQRA